MLLTNSNFVTVVGSGQMGIGIAYSFAMVGCEVTLIDTDPMALTRAKAKLGELVSEAAQRGKMTLEEAATAYARVAYAGALGDGVAKASLFIETATENIAIKQAIFRSAEPLLNPRALLATNTSALGITEIGSVLVDPARLVGMHFFNPVHKMKLVELVRGLLTSAEAVATAREWVERIGKTSIVVNEAPGFTTSRMSALMGNEAMYMLAEGVATAEDIDTSMRLAFRHPMGALEMGDLTGWDTRLVVLEYLEKVYGEKFRPCPLIRKLVQAGRHGCKTGVGVYRYDSHGNRIPGSGLKVSE